MEKTLKARLLHEEIVRTAKTGVIELAQVLSIKLEIMEALKIYAISPAESEELTKLVDQCSVDSLIPAWLSVAS